MASKVFEKFLQNASPEQRAAIQKSVERVESKINTDHELKAAPQTKTVAPDPAKPKLAESAKLQPSQGNAMTRLAEADKSRTGEVGQELQKKNVTMDKEPER